ncbi:MAG: hypothetical protein NW214_10035 [Pseudanabaenaceae cyanobacterium bins.39]|nr:hypothetical protein [Pseudanabaenaceae cyanobacterium bins.39]
MTQNTSNKNEFYITQDVEAYTDSVDNLMDDLFGEVESTLHVDPKKQRNSKAKPSQLNVTGKSISSSNSQSLNNYAHSSSADMVAVSRLESSDAVSKDTVSITKLNMADISLPPISKQDVLWIQPYVMRDPEPPSSPVPAEPEVAIAKYSLLDRLLLVAACSSALLAAVMWTVNHGIWLGRQSANTAPVISADNQKNQAFAEEIKRMFADISTKNRAIASSRNLAGAVGNTVPVMAAPVLGNALPIGANPLVGIQQQPMYVPVYQPPNLANNTNNTANLPSPLALPPAAANGEIATKPTNSQNNNPNPTPSSNVSAPVVVTAPAQSYTLIGVLDLGDRSTAMFDINGSVQSVGLNKAVGSSGWILSRVSQQEIVLKKGKATKNVFVGQKF